MKALLLLALIGLVGCGGQTTIREERRVCVKVFMHQPNEYSCMYFDPSTSELKTVSFRNWYKDETLKIVADVPPDNPMYYEATYKTTDRIIDTHKEVYAAIHIHGAEDIQGGGWDHGKFGRGQTIIVEDAK